MKRKISILFFLCLITLMSGYGQNDTDILDPGSTRSEEISKSRRVLLDKFLESDRLGIILEMDRLITLEDNDYTALYPVEFWLLSYWLEDYMPVLASVRQLDAEKEVQNRQIKIPPQRDYLTAKLFEKSNDEKKKILQGITLSTLSEEEKELLRMHVEYLLSDGADQKNNQELLNRLADHFLTQFPNSEYNGFVKKYIRIKYLVSDDGYAFYFFSGKILFGGNLTDYYKNPTLAGLSFEGLRSKWLYQLNLTFGFCRTKREMPVRDGLWPKGSKATGGYADVAIGRQMVNNKTFFLAPLAGIGVFGLDPNTNANKEPDYKGGGIKTHIAGRVGFVTDIKLGSGKQVVDGFFHQYIASAIPSVRIGYDYILTPLKNDFTEFSGSVHRIIVGIGISQRKIKRDF